MCPVSKRLNGRGRVLLVRFWISVFLSYLGLSGTPCTWNRLLYESLPEPEVPISILKGASVSLCVLGDNCGQIPLWAFFFQKEICLAGESLLPWRVSLTSAGMGQKTLCHSGSK